jgi:hypothetical protein
MIDRGHGPSLSGCGDERIARQAAEQIVPNMLGVLLHLGNHGSHLLEDGRTSLIVNIALEQL